MRNVDRLRMAASALAAIALLGLGVVTALLMTDRIRILPLLSGSMAPYLETGDAGLLRPVPRDDIAVGDIIVFVRPGEAADSTPTVHRIIGMGVDDDGTPTATTKGDNNDSVDPWELRLEDETIWRVEASLPGVGWISWKIKEPIVWFSVLALGGVAIIAWGMWVIWAPVPDEDEWIEAQLGLAHADPLTASLIRGEIARRRAERDRQEVPS